MYNIPEPQTGLTPLQAGGDTINLREYAGAPDLKAEGYHKLFGTVYRYFQKHGNATTLEEWEAAAQAIAATANRYQGTPLNELATALLVAVYEEMKRRYKKRAEVPAQG